jgi:hypothetical protein
MQSTLTPTETDPHDIFVIEPDVVLAARADHPPAAPAVGPISHSAPKQAEITPDVAAALSDAAAALSIPTVDTTFRATASSGAPAAGEIHAPEIAVPSDIHLNGKRPARGWMARAMLGFVFAIGAAAASAAWEHYGDTAKTMIANWTPFVLTPQPSQAAAKPAIAEQPSPPDTQGSAQASATDQAPAPSAPAAQPAQDTAPAAAAAPPSPSSAQDIAAMGQQIEALKASIEQLKAGQEQLSQQMAQQIAKETAKANAARKLSALTPQPVAPPAHKPRPAFSPAMAAAALASSHAPTPAAPPPAAYRPQQPAAAPPPQYYQPRAQIVDQTDVDADTVVRPPMPLR